MKPYEGGNTQIYFDSAFVMAERAMCEAYAQQVIEAIASVVQKRFKDQGIEGLNADSPRVIAESAEAVAQAIARRSEKALAWIQEGLSNDLLAAAQTGGSTEAAIRREVVAGRRYASRSPWYDVHLALVKATCDYLDWTTSPATVAHRT